MRPDLSAPQSRHRLDAAGFLAGILASLAAREPEAEALFDDEKLRTYLGVGAE